VEVVSELSVGSSLLADLAEAEVAEEAVVDPEEGEAAVAVAVVPQSLAEPSASASSVS